MGLRKLVLTVAVMAAALAPAAASAEGKFGALVFGDYYYFVEEHDSATAEQNGFWIRRVNLTWDEKFDDAFSARLRIETASPGDFLPDNQDVMITYMKDAWIRWKHNNQSLYLGLTQNPSHSFIEEFWGYRHLEKIPGELQGFYGSRDMGLAAQGSLGASKKLGYHVMVGNGTGTRNELDGRKKISGEARYSFTSALVAEVYADYEDRAGNTDRVTLRGFLGYKKEKFRAGAEYVQQTRDQENADSYDLGVISGFAAGQVAEKVWLLGRVDRAMDPGASKPGAPYFPMTSEVPSTFILAGVELVARENITFTPNVEVALYDAPEDGSPTPKNDVVARVTFMYKY
ncbi:MAG: hypothetical protein OEX18_00880 [Candidatus Krumholzibacteria bacterium]|nr:hypothetical protein [Candidatus Krumholzibacteria bacterium]MDH4335818.1 hypothetical protein [Candidatus Krumholzibacteria bacterium]MDH5269344.1 hypothetical protein [Candidatus Krumholzibacteria bacterium]MDH5627686.1 hypothetical protein [Candidatus Krumholzibacteria bacterium]